MSATRVTQPLDHNTLGALNNRIAAPMGTRELLAAAAGQPVPQQTGAWPQNAGQSVPQSNAWPQNVGQSAPQSNAWPQNVGQGVPQTGAWPQNARQSAPQPGAWPQNVGQSAPQAGVWPQNIGQSAPQAGAWPQNVWQTPPPGQGAWPQDVPARRTPVENVQPAYGRNTGNHSPAPPVSTPAPPPQRNGRTVPPPPAKPIPELLNPLMKGQKTSLSRPGTDVRKVRAMFGWNVNDGRCDVDVSAFLLGADGKVPGDEWFVFYGQPASPDGAVTLNPNPGQADRSELDVALTQVSPAVKRIVFVLTIHEAFANHLNFSMLRDAYIRILDDATGKELLSFRMGDYYATVTSMTIGELYLHNGQWKFNPVGNGVEQDMAGQCAIYGVRIQ